MAKAVKLSGTPRTRTPLTPEARENQMISLALEKQRDLAAAKAESIKAADRLEELLPKVMKAMGRYRGDDEEEGDPDDDY